MIETLIAAATVLLCVAGAFFFFAGSVGLLRFPDVFTRLHLVNTADTLGLGLIVLALSLQATSPVLVIKMAIIWLLVMIGGVAVCQLISQAALQTGFTPWERPQ